MIVIAGHVAGIVIGDRAGLRVGVPYAGAAAVFARRALDLKARGRHAPDKIAPSSARSRTVRNRSAGLT